MRLRLDFDAPSAGQQYLQTSVEPRFDGTSVVFCAGELDVAVAPRLRDAIDAAFEMATTGVRVDFHHLTYIDSAGLRELLLGQARAARTGLAFSVANPAPQIRRLFEIADIARLIDDED